MSGQVLSVAGVRAFAAVLQAALLLLLARELGPANFGVYALVSAILGFLIVMLNLGTTTLALRVNATEDPAETIVGISTHRLVIILPSLLVATILSGAISPAYWVPALAAGAGVALETSAMIQESTLFGQQRVKLAQWTMLARRVGVAAGVVLAWALGGNVIWAFIIANVLGSLMLVGVVSRAGLSLVAMKAVIRQARPYWMPTLLARIETLDVPVAALVLAPASLGSYSASARLAAPLQLIPSSILSVNVPHLAGESNDVQRRKSIKKSILLVLMLFAPAVLATPLVGRLAETLLGEGYESVSVLLTILVSGVMINAISQCLIGYFYAIREPNHVRNARMIGMPVGLISVPLAGIAIGAVGAALGVVLMHLLVLLLMGRKYYIRG